MLSSAARKLSLLLRQQNHALKQSVIETLNMFVFYARANDI